MTAKASEANFDGLVGPTHNYAGLSYGNVASTNNLGAASSPRNAALQGLAKMKALAELGLVQGVLPPQERPDVRALRRLGFAGTDAQVIERAAKEDATLLALASSASAMWTANAATVAPSADTADRRVHFTPANLLDRPHRAIEHAQTTRTLRAIFRDEARFVVHEPLAMGQAFSDEGAANHTRLVGDDERALHLFVYGRRGIGGDAHAPKKFPARQTYEASRAVARLHGLDGDRALLVQQNPDVIDEGVFHNDVIAVGHGRALFFHERAFADRDATLRAIAERVPGFEPIEVRDDELSVDAAVKTYLFNSQLLTLPDGARALVAPEECREHEGATRVLDRLVASGALDRVLVFDLRQSMRNGGGPACLRLRVVLTSEERAAIDPRCLIDATTHARLVAWATKHYRDRLEARDLADPKLLDESRTALDELTQLLGVGSIYPFQRER